MCDVSFHIYSNEALVSMVNAAILLCDGLHVRLDGPREFYIDLLKCSYSLALFALAQLHTQLPDDSGINKAEIIHESLTKLQKILREWVIRSDVIGGSLFGAFANPAYWKAETEIKVCVCVCVCVLYEYPYSLAIM